MVKIIICIAFLAIWIYLLWVLDRAKLEYWRFLVGSCGAFLFMMIVLRPVLTQPLARAVATLAGIVGNLTNTFHAYFIYGIMFIQSQSDTITLQINFECSGIIEIMAFLSLLAFFRVYKVNERIMVGILGIMYIMFANALRIVVICEMIHFMGSDVYYISHTVIGRLVFYVLSILLYFYVFTKPQIIRMKIGKFTYGHN